MDIINSVVNSLLSGDYGMAPVNWPAVLLGLLLAFAGGQVIAWIYMVTHSGLSYSRSFVNALIVMPVIVALVMMVLSNNLVTAFGMMAVFAIVRFRNILRDTLATSYVLIVNLHWARSAKETDELRRVLDRHSSKAHLASQRSHESYEGTDLSYRLLLRDSERSEDLITELRQVAGVSRVTSMLAEDESEL